ncbi:hypothetical protein MRX96_040748 [Rhipicephalus microplus]
MFAQSLAKPGDVRKKIGAQPQDPGGPREEPAPGLPDAWVAAIAVNVALVALFLVFVLYCYIRSRKRVDDDEEPELKGLSPDESDEELPSEPLPIPDTQFVKLSQVIGVVDVDFDIKLSNGQWQFQGGQYQVCLVAGGGRDCVGSIELPLDRPVTLAELRTALGKEPDTVLSELASASHYCFVTEALRPLSPGETDTCIVQQIYPSRAIMLRDIREAVETSPVSWEEPDSTTPPVICHDLVGPLGVCQRPDCNQPGRVKCIDCGLASYCSSRCLKADARRHSMSCYRDHLVPAMTT